MPESPRKAEDVSKLGLTRRQLLALAAHEFDRLTDREIAEKFGVGRSAVTKRRRRARATLARYESAMNRGAAPRVKFRPFSLLASDNV